MPEPRHWHIISYDVRDPKRLRKVYKILCAWGESLQFSVFRVRGTARELARLRFELARVVTPDDSLLVSRLCPGCASRLQVVGRSRIEELSLAADDCKIV
jgi:CRISPR-associated protein Cas2